jgi:long-chain acyl-CoA synthetase
VRVSQVTMLHEYLERIAALRPDASALVCQGRRLSWAQIHAAAGRVAHTLRALGLRRGDRVLLHLPNSVELCASIAGVLAADGVFVPVNAQTKADKLAYLLDDCRARVLITDRALEPSYAPAVERAAHLEHVLVVGGAGDRARLGGATIHDFADATAAAPETWPVAHAIPVDLASIVYTSGSTGGPKGVMLTHHNMVSAVESITTYLACRADDVVLCVLPLSFDYGLYQWLMAGHRGHCLVLEPSFSYPAAVIETIERERVTGLPVVPTIASILAQHEARGLRLSRVRYVTNTAAALSVSHIEALARLCPNARIYSMYGLTECKRVSYLPPERIADKPTSVGVPMPNMEVFVATPDGRVLPPGEVGELCVRGPHVMRGYWEKPEATAAALRPSPDVPGEMWLRTGDQFRIDDEGFLYFIGRTDDVIKTRGEKASPREIEDALYALAGVQDAAVVGQPDEVLGQAIRAFLVMADGARITRAEVIGHCARRLEPFLVPRHVTFLSSLPKTPSGKITKKGIWEHARATRVDGDEV